MIQILITPNAGLELLPVDRVLAVPGKGLEGDRYFNGSGSLSKWGGIHREVTLIAEEDLKAMADDTGIELSAAQSRRNILTRGIALQPLLKQTFTIGDVTMRGVRICQPCKYLARKTNEPDLVKALVHRGGLRAQVLTEGHIKIGDPVMQVDQLAYGLP